MPATREGQAASRSWSGLRGGIEVGGGGGGVRGGVEVGVRGGVLGGVEVGGRAGVEVRVGGGMGRARDGRGATAAARVELIWGMKWPWGRTNRVVKSEVPVARSRKGVAAMLATARSRIHAAAIAISSSAGPLYALLLGWASHVRLVQT